MSEGISEFRTVGCCARGLEGSEMEFADLAFKGFGGYAYHLGFFGNHLKLEAIVPEARSVRTEWPPPCKQSVRFLVRTFRNVPQDPFRGP